MRLLSTFLLVWSSLKLLFLWKLENFQLNIRAGISKLFPCSHENFSMLTWPSPVVYNKQGRTMSTWKTSSGEVKFYLQSPIQYSRNFPIVSQKFRCKHKNIPSLTVLQQLNWMIMSCALKQIMEMVLAPSWKCQISEMFLSSEAVYWKCIRNFQDFPRFSNVNMGNFQGQMNFKKLNLRIYVMSNAQMFALVIDSWELRKVLGNSQKNSKEFPFLFLCRFQILKFSWVMKTWGLWKILEK